MKRTHSIIESIFEEIEETFKGHPYCDLVLSRKDVYLRSVDKFAKVDEIVELVHSLQDTGKIHSSRIQENEDEIQIYIRKKV